jgi:hypothetical protein
MKKLISIDSSMIFQYGPGIAYGRIGISEVEKIK